MPSMTLTASPLSTPSIRTREDGLPLWTESEPYFTMTSSCSASGAGFAGSWDQQVPARAGNIATNRSAHRNPNVLRTMFSSSPSIALHVTIATHAKKSTLKQSPAFTGSIHTQFSPELFPPGPERLDHRGHVRRRRSAEGHGMPRFGMEERQRF